MRSITCGFLSLVVLSLGAATGCSMLVGPKDPQKASISQFIKIRSPRSGHLAADGTFYYIDLHKGTPQLHRRGPGKDKGTLLTRFSDGIGGYQVSDDARWIAITAAEGGSEQNDIYLMNASTGEMDPILVDLDTVYGSVVWNHNSTGFAYRANDVSKADFYIYYYDLEQRQSRLVSDRVGSWFPVDFKKDNARILAGYYVSSTESYLWEMSLVGEGARALSSLDDVWRYSGVGYGPDGKSVYVITDYRSPRMGLARIELTSNALEPLLAQFSKFEVDGAKMNRDRDVMAVVLNVDGLSELHLFSVPDFEPLPTPELPEGTIGNVGFRDDYLIFALNNAKNPSIIYKWPLGQTDVAPIGLTKADTQGIDIERFVMPELVHFRSFDDLEIPAFIYLPAGYQPGKPIPFVVYYHGGPEGQYRPQFAKLFQYFLSRGYGVLAPNVRGSSGYGTGYLKLDNYRNRMDSVKDGVAAAQWLIDAGYSAPGLIAAHGGSYGGFMVVAAITQAPQIFGAACNVVGIVNFETFLQRTKDYRRKLREEEYGPLMDSEFLRSISPIYLVDRVETPILIVHGRNDPRVPLFEAEQLYEALRKRGKTAEMMVFDDEGHGLRKEPNQIKFYGRLVEFFDAHLRPKVGR